MSQVPSDGIAAVDNGPADQPLSRDPLGLVGAVAVFLIFFTVIVDVAMRTFLGSGILGANTIISDWWMAAVALLGIAVAERRGSQIVVDVVAESVSARTSRYISIFAAVVTAVFALLVAVSGLQEAITQTRLGEYEAVGNLPIWPARFLVPIGFLGLAVFTVAGAVRAWRRTGR